MRTGTPWPLLMKEPETVVPGPPRSPSFLQGQVYKHRASKFSVCGFLCPRNHLSSCISVHMYSSSYLLSTQGAFEVGPKCQVLPWRAGAGSRPGSRGRPP